MIYSVYVGLAAASAAAVSLAECVDCSSAETENDDCYNNVTDIGKPLLPYLIAESDTLE